MDTNQFWSSLRVGSHSVVMCTLRYGRVAGKRCEQMLNNSVMQKKISLTHHNMRISLPVWEWQQWNCTTERQGGKSLRLSANRFSLPGKERERHGVTPKKRSGCERNWGYSQVQNFGSQIVVVCRIHNVWVMLTAVATWLTVTWLTETLTQNLLLPVVAMTPSSS